METRKIKISGILGVDPGVSNGGMVLWRPNGTPTAIRMPRDMQDLRDYLEYVKTICQPIVFLEKLSVRTDDVAVGADGANMGKLFRIQKMIANYEQLKTTIELSGIPFVLVHPLKWQTGLKIRIKASEEDKATRKKRYKDIAQKLYPSLKQTLWSSDATLIMHFGRYILANDIGWVKQNLPKPMQEKLF